jgi:anthranilate synthase component 1
MLQAIEQAKIGDIVPVYKAIDNIDALDLFAKLSDYGRKKNCILFEFKGKAIGSADPCLKLSGLKDQFEVTALNNVGRRFLASLKGDFKFCEKVQYGQNRIIGTLKKPKMNASEGEKLKLKTHLDVIRKVAFKFKPASEQFTPYCGLFGAFSHDFVEYFEELPEKEDSLSEPYYEFYFLDNLFATDTEGKTCLLSNALITDGKREKAYKECLEKIESYEKALKKKAPKAKKCKAREHVTSTDTSREEFEENINLLKKKIAEGNIHMAILCRIITSNYNAEPFDIYKELRALNPSPYMFYINTTSGILLGASHHHNLSIAAKEKTIEVGLRGSTRPNGKDADLANKYETELKIGFSEIGRHLIEIDAVRSDVARASKLGSRHLDRIFAVEKQGNAQHLVSNVKGTLKDDLDALHAYLSCINRIDGCPKIEAARLLRQFEKTKRGYFHGSVCYIDAAGNLESAIIKNAIRLKNKKAHIGVDALVCHDSIAEEKFGDTEKKAQICLQAIKSAGGLK